MPKLLGEFLEEQQEPFTLDVYLLERGYCTRTRVPNPNSARFHHRKRQQAIPNCAEVVTAVFSRILLHKKIKNPRKKESSNVDEANEDELFSSASATTLYNSCSESDVEANEDADCSSSHEAEADTNCFNMRSMEDCDNKQLSPISVLEETESQASPLHQKQYNMKKLTKGESSKSMSQRRSKHKSGQNLQEHCMDPFNQYNINKRALQTKKKLLVDCVREVIENERRRDEGGSGKQLRKVLGAEELWKVVCENVWLWSQESICENNVIHNVRCDFMASLEEWDCDAVSMEIGDAILEDVINEIVTYSMLVN